VDEFVALLQQEGEDLNFLFGSYPPGGVATATGAFTTAYGEQFGKEGVETTLGRYLSATPLLVPAFAALLRGDVPPPGTEPLTKDSLQTVFVHATRALAAERPTVVMIDDLHFAPDEGRALFLALALAAPGHRLLLVGTARPGLPEAWTASVTRPDHASRFDLPRLGAKDLGHLLTDVFRSERLAEELALQIATKPDGNPFFVFEIVRELREGEFVTQEPDGTWVRTRDIRQIQIPSSVMDLIQARIAELEEKDRELLDVAACWGFEFDPTLVAEALRMGVLPSLRRFGRIEKRERLVRSAGRRYVFDHHQVQEALYAGLFEPLREQYHAALAGALEVRAAAAEKDLKELDGGVAVGLCEHFLRGGQGQRALRYLDAALSHLEQGYRNAAAVELADRAVAVGGLLEGRERIAVLLRKCKGLELLGRWQEEGVALEEVLHLAEATGDAAVQARVRRSASSHLSRIARHEEARAGFEQALDLARAAGDRSEEGTVVGYMANVLLNLGRYEEARDHGERALAIAREVGNRAGQASAYGNLGVTEYYVSRYEPARGHLEQQLELVRQLGDRSGEVSASGNLAGVCLDLGRYEDALNHIEQGLATARSIGERDAEGILTANLGSVLEALGRLAEAQSHRERSLALFLEVGHRVGEAVALFNLGLGYTFLGDLGRARPLLEASRALSVAIGSRRVEGYTLQGLSLVEEQAGDAHTAERFMREALALNREIGHSKGVAEALVNLGQDARKAGAPEAPGLLTEALALARELDCADVIVAAATHMALLPGGDAAPALAVFAANESRMSYIQKMEARFLLWQATGDGIHLEAAHELLVHLRDHAPPEYRDTMIVNVLLYRDIQAAWEAGGR